MVTTQTPTLEGLTLWQVCRLLGVDGLDIGDDIWDWGIFLGCDYESLDKAEDWYDKCMMLFALNLKVIKCQPQWYTICNVSEFISDNIQAFTKFFNEENKDDYKPESYDDNVFDKDSDNGFYDVFMQSMECLIAGNYSESDYQKLYGYLTA